MITGNENAYPLYGPDVTENELGLTIRQHFAAINVGHIINRWYEMPGNIKLAQLEDWVKKYGKGITIKDAISKDGCELADALIAELNKPTKTI